MSVYNYGGIRFHVLRPMMNHATPFGNVAKIYCTATGRDGRFVELAGATWRNADELSPGEPALQFRNEDGALQKLMDALWDAGVRPNTSVDDAEKRALRGHLEDMRQLAFFGSMGQNAPKMAQ